MEWKTTNIADPVAKKSFVITNKKKENISFHNPKKKNKKANQQEISYTRYRKWTQSLLLFRLFLYMWQSIFVPINNVLINYLSYQHMQIKCIHN